MPEMLQNFAANLLDLTLESAPWLLLGLVVAGLLQSLVPTSLLSRWLGGRGFGPVLRAALLGTPLPLCSCSVVPAAVTLRRGGASRGATVSFLIATPENGADSIALSYVLLGPMMTIARPVAAIISAVSAGVLANLAPEPAPRSSLPLRVASTSDCCSSGRCDASTQAAMPRRSTLRERLAASARYVCIDLLGDIALWLAVGLVAAAAVRTFVPPNAMAQWGSGLPAMLAMLAIGVPMYICATASTPLAAAMLLAGVSPGTVLVFLLAGPATNIGTIGVVRRELGNASTAAYLAGVCVVAVASGLVTDWLVRALAIDIVAQTGGTHVADWPVVSWASLLVLLAMAGYLVWTKVHTSAHAHDHSHEPAEAH
jgi:uncharacterized membrane protein YraQ (UPF0718 family)